MTTTSHEVELMGTGEPEVEASGEQVFEAASEQIHEASGEQAFEASSEAPSSTNKDSEAKSDGSKDLHFHGQLEADIAESSGSMELVSEESDLSQPGEPASNSAVANANTSLSASRSVTTSSIANSGEAIGTNTSGTLGSTGAANGLSLPAALCDDTLLEEIQSIPNKMGFKIGDVADMLGIKQYVLRYWETEFDLLKPKKASNNQRMYTRKDVENAFLIRKLLHRDRFSIEGARNALKELKAHVKKEKDYSQVVHRLENIHDRIEDLVLEIRRARQLFK